MDCKYKRRDIIDGIFSCPLLESEADGEADEDGDFHIAHNGSLVSNAGNSPRFAAVFPEFQQSFEEQRSFMNQCLQGNRLLQDEDFELPISVTNIEYIEWLREKGPFLMSPRNRNPNLTCKILLKLSGDLMVLNPPGEVPCLGSARHMFFWTLYLNMLTSELMDVEENCNSEVRDNGVFVLTSWPYKEFLKELAAEVMQHHGPRVNPLLQDQDLNLPVNISSKEYIDWLEKVWPKNRSSFIVTNKERTRRILLKLADDLDYLLPGDSSRLLNIVERSRWRCYWNEMLSELKTVEENCSSDIRNSGVYMLTTWPFKEFLRMLAQKFPEMENDDDVI